MLIDLPPEEFLLDKIKEALETVDWADRTGVEGISVRHYRSRAPSERERPCISIQFIESGPREDEEQLRNTWEQVMELEINLRGDIELSPADETGTRDLSRMLAAAFTELRREDPASLLRPWISWVVNGRTAADDDNTSEKGRLIRGVTVLYRVSAEDPNILLAEGTMGQ